MRPSERAAAFSLSSKFGLWSPHRADDGPAFIMFFSIPIATYHHLCFTNTDCILQLVTKCVTNYCTLWLTDRVSDDVVLAGASPVKGNQRCQPLSQLATATNPDTRGQSGRFATEHTHTTNNCSRTGRSWARLRARANPKYARRSRTTHIRCVHDISIAGRWFHHPRGR